MAVERAGCNRRNPAKEQAWRELVAKQAQSRIPVARFCRERGITASVFYYWKQELARRDDERNAASHSRGPQPTKPAAEFAEVAVMNSEQAREFVPRNAVPITIHFATGCRIEVPVGFDARTLREIIRVLRGESC